MAAADKNVKDSINLKRKFDSNVNEEKETVSDAISQKKKNARKNKKKKKKSSSTSNAEEICTNTEMEITNNVDSENKITDDNVNAENKVNVNTNAESQTTETVDKETDTVDEACSEEELEDIEKDEEMSDADVKVRVKDIINTKLKIDSNANEENETISDVIPQKKKRTRKNRKKKKKSKGTANSEKIFTNTEKEMINNVDSESKRTYDNVNEESQTTETVDKETNTVDEGYSELGPEDTEQDEEITAYIYETSLHFANNFERYLTRCYDIFNRGKSDIPEDSSDLPHDCKILLRGSVGRYKSTNYFNIFRPTTNLQNRCEDLRTVFREALVLKGDVVSHTEFLRFSALYFLTAYDLKNTLGFEEAPYSAVNALVDAIMQTKQKKVICLWYPFD